MTGDHALAFLLFAVVAAITPGPSNIILASTGANVGILRGVPSLLGVTLGMGFMMFAVAFGIGSAVIDHPTLLTGLKWAGGAFLLWLAWKIATAGRAHVSESRNAIGFWNAAAFQWINPKSWMACAGAVGTYLSADGSSALTQSLLFGLLFIAASIPCCTVWLGFGAGVQRFLQTDRAVRIFNVSMGVVLAASIALLIH